MQHINSKTHLFLEMSSDANSFPMRAHSGCIGRKWSTSGSSTSDIDVRIFREAEENAERPTLIKAPSVDDIAKAV